MTFWFTRHGVSEYNLEDRIGGDSNITPKGQVFADTLPSLFGRVLQESGDDHRFISVWTSTLIRTIQTASKLPLPQVCATRSSFWYDRFVRSQYQGTFRGFICTRSSVPARAVTRTCSAALSQRMVTHSLSVLIWLSNSKAVIIHLLLPCHAC